MVVVPIAVALVCAQQLSLHDQRNRAEIMAGVVLNRTAMTTEQLNSAFQRMSVFDAAHACSPEAVTLMRQIDLSSSLLQGVGYIEGNTLKCSSLGDNRPVDAGPYDYVSATQTYFRRQRDLGIAPGALLLLVTAKSGYTALVHPALIFSLNDAAQDLPSGVVSYSTREDIINSGRQTFDWHGVDLPANQHGGTLTMGNQIVGWERSPVWDHFTYAAIPVAAVASEFDTLARIFVPTGIAMGIFALWLTRRFVANRASLPALLRAGLKRDEILTVYQPIVDMRTGRWVGAEVLARWRRPGGEWVPPDVFVQIAERHGLVSQLTQRVIARSCAEFGGFAQAHEAFFISINISSADLRDPDFCPTLAATCATRGIAHERVHLEITERTEVDPELEAATIATLRGMGFKVGIDDFGIGYSNLAYLDLLQLDYLKIDRAFVAGLSRGQIGTEIVDHIIELAAGRGLQLIAEGVEREEQRAELISRGVTLAQGWLFGRPMSAIEFTHAYAEKETEPSVSSPALAHVA